MKLKQLRLDEAIMDLRPINDVTVSRYRQAMRNGDVFPKLIVDASNRIIAGYHRYTAALKEFGEDYQVEVERIKPKDAAERIEMAVRDNAKHGLPLDGISRKRAIMRLNEYGRSPEAIAKLLGISAKRVEDLAGLSVVVVGAGKRKNHPEPVKRGLEHMAGRKVSETQYESHRTKDRGVPACQAAKQLIRWIEAGWVDTTDAKTVEALAELSEAIRGMKI